MNLTTEQCMNLTTEQLLAHARLLAPVTTAILGREVVVTRERVRFCLGWDYDCPRCQREHRRGHPTLPPSEALCRSCKAVTGQLAECMGCGTLLDPEEVVCRACSCQHCGAPAVTCTCDRGRYDAASAEVDERAHERAHGPEVRP